MFSTYYSLCTLFFCCSMFSIRDHFMNFMPPTTLTRCSIPPCSILALFLPQQYFVHWIHPTKKRFICWCFVLRTTTTCAVDCEASLIIINAPLYNVVSIKCLKNVYHNSQVPNSKINSNVTRNGTLLNCIYIVPNHNIYYVKAHYIVRSRAYNTIKKRNSSHSEQALSDSGEGERNSRKKPPAGPESAVGGTSASTGRGERTDMGDGRRGRWEERRETSNKKRNPSCVRCLIH